MTINFTNYNIYLFIDFIDFCVSLPQPITKIYRVCFCLVCFFICPLGFL